MSTHDACRSSPASPDEDIGRIGIGEGGLLVTPLQMAMVAAAVANGGTLMKPHLIARVVDQDGRTVRTTSPSVVQPGDEALDRRRRDAR